MGVFTRRAKDGDAGREDGAEPLREVARAAFVLTPRERSALLLVLALLLIGLAVRHLHGRRPLSAPPEAEAPARASPAAGRTGG